MIRGMRSVQIDWDPEGARFTATGTWPGREIVINAPHPEDQPAAGFSPTELLLAGAGACSAWDVVQIMRKQRQDLRTLSVLVEGSQDSRPPHAYDRVTMHFRAEGTGLRREAVERAVKLSIDKYCSVVATFRPETELVTTVEVVETGAHADD
jgi:putative redox protein